MFRDRLMLASGSTVGDIFVHFSLATSSVHVSCLPSTSSRMRHRQTLLRESYASRGIVEYVFPFFALGRGSRSCVSHLPVFRRKRCVFSSLEYWLPKTT